LFVLTDEHGLLLVGELILEYEQLHQLAVVPLNLLPEVVQNNLQPKIYKKKSKIILDISDDVIINFFQIGVQF
jgi:hypothetical protein